MVSGERATKQDHAECQQRRLVKAAETADDRVDLGGKENIENNQQVVLPTAAALSS